MKETLPALPIEWIKRVFMRFNATYGPALMRGTWGDDDLSEVWQVWAEELGRFKDHSGAIKYALDNLPHDYPPNLLAFKDLCREGLRNEPKPLALPEKITEEQMQRNRERSAELVKSVLKPTNHRKWIYAMREREFSGEHFTFEVDRIYKEAIEIESNEHPETWNESIKKTA